MSELEPKKKLRKKAGDTVEVESLHELELELLEKYKLLEAQQAKPVKSTSVTDKEKRKSELVAAAKKREEEAKVRFQKNIELKKLRARKLAGEALPEIEPLAVAASSFGAGVGGGVGVNVEKQGQSPAKSVVVKQEWDPKNPGWPFSEHLETFVSELPNAKDESNPHLKQNQVGFFVSPLERIPKCLDTRMGLKKYDYVSKSRRSTLHWIGRKLLMQEIDFLTKFGENEMLVIYAGAAPGAHLQILSEMFPQLRFLLIDSMPFKCAASERIESWIQADPFGNTVLEELLRRREKKLLISDIRTGGSGAERNDADKCIAEDMERQMSWHQRLKSEQSLLKFRLPWEEGETTYLDGELFFSCYGPQTTTETRMSVGKECGMRQYDHKTYEEQMFYFNRMTRGKGGVEACLT